MTRSAEPPKYYSGIADSGMTAIMKTKKMYIVSIISNSMYTPIKMSSHQNQIVKVVKMTKPSSKLKQNEISKSHSCFPRLHLIQTLVFAPQLLISIRHCCSKSRLQTYYYSKCRCQVSLVNSLAPTALPTTSQNQIIFSQNQIIFPIACFC